MPCRNLNIYFEIFKMKIGAVYYVHVKNKWSIVAMLFTQTQLQLSVKLQYCYIKLIIIDKLAFDTVIFQ